MELEYDEVELPTQFLGNMRVYRVPLSDGSEGRWEVLVTQRSGVVVLAITPEKKVVMVEMWRFGVETRMRELPGGVIDPPETPIEAAERELREETGYVAESIKVIARVPLSSRKLDVHIFVCLATGCTKLQDPQLDIMEEATGLVSFEMEPHEIVAGIAYPGSQIDLMVSHALLVAGIIHL